MPCRGAVAAVQKEADYEAFEPVLAKAHENFPIEILAYCVMPNHWHFVLHGVPLALPVLVVDHHRSSTLSGIPRLNGRPANCCWGGVSKYQLALDLKTPESWN